MTMAYNVEAVMRCDFQHLYYKITTASEPDIPTATKVEPAFFKGLDDPSDIPVVVVCEHVCSQGLFLPSGFAADENGNLIRTGSGEDIEVVAELDHDEKEDLGRGWRMSKKLKRYGGDKIWETI